MVYRAVAWIGLATALSVWSACSFDAGGLAAGPRQDARAAGPPVVDGRLDGPVVEAGADAVDLLLTDQSGDQPLPHDTLPPDAAILCSSWTPAPKHFKPCDVGAPVAGLALSTAGVWTYDTDTGWLTDPKKASSMPQSKLLKIGGVEARVISVTSFVVAKGATLRARGSRPLVVAVWFSATISGTVDVSSVRDLILGTQTLGAGANPGACSGAAPTAGKEHSSQGGGGGGGGFGEDGGDGGDGDDDNAAGGSKGSAVSAPTTVVRGGCAGAKGGVSSGGSGGAGGGALQLTARLAITVSGLLHAGGAGGGGGAALSESGGGGGGSGGYLGLEAPAVTLTASAVLAANGGGGGGGAADASLGLPGANGPASTAAAPGGFGGMFGKGGTGGAGGHQGTLAGGTGGKSSDGGGGGGGGAGHVVITASNYNDNNPTISAKASTP